jgi:hypothetical protein
VVNRFVEAQFLLYELALPWTACDSYRSCAGDPRELSNQRSDRTACGGNDHRLTLGWFSDDLQTGVRSESGHSEDPSRVVIGANAGFTFPVRVPSEIAWVRHPAKASTVSAAA